MIQKYTLMAMAMASPALLAEDFTVTAEPFQKKVSIQGLAVPQEAAEISIAPKAYSDFPIEKLMAHGTRVKKGDRLVWIDTEAFDRYIFEQEKAREAELLQLKAAEQELKELDLKTARDLAKEELNFKRKEADFRYFINVTLPQNMREQKLRQEKVQWYFQNTNEELTQLLKMYEADGLTEETEEIIIKRARNSVKSAAFERDKGLLAAEWNLEVLIPRQKQDQEIAFEAAKTHYESAQLSIPRALKLKEISVAKARRADAQKAKKLEQLKQDRKLANLVAPFDGVVYHGQFTGSKWDNVLARKMLVKGAKLPAHKVLMTVVPEGASLRVVASVDAASAAALKKGMQGQASASSNSWLKFSSQVSNVSQSPNLANQWDVELNPQLDQNSSVVAGESIKVDVITYSQEKAISVPVKAITHESDGSYSVKVKMADGKVAVKTVKIGHNAGDKVEILQGLTAGQVVIFE